jgi:hypothetical protein
MIHTVKIYMFMWKRRMKCWEKEKRSKKRENRLTMNYKLTINHTKMIEKINLNNILFLDIETVPEHQNYGILDEETRYLWEHKTQYQRKDEVHSRRFLRKSWNLGRIW